MSKGNSSKPAAAAGGGATQPSVGAIKKERSFRSLFSFFKSSKHDKKSSSLPEPRYPNRSATKTIGLSTASLPAQTSKENEDDENSDSDSPRAAGHWHSTTSLPSQVRPPFARHSPTSSSSSASSFEFPSDASTAATSPSNSSPSVLIKSLSSASVTTNGSTTSVASSPSAEHSSPPNQTSTKPLKMSKSSKRATDSYQKQPSPLSSVMDAHSPYIFPAPPQMSTHDSQIRRRSSLGSFLLRRSHSHPDLADLTPEELPPLPPMPASAPSGPAPSYSAISRAKTFRRRSADSRKRDGIGGYTDQEKLERISILGADPVGYGYHLYPASQKETNNRRNSGMGQPSSKRGKPGYVDDWNKGGWGGLGSEGFGGGRGGGTGTPSGRAWKDSRGRGFRRAVAQQAIPEEAGDAFDPESTTSKSTGPSRRSSEGFGLGPEHLRQSPTSAGPVPSIPQNQTAVVDKITSLDKKECDSVQTSCAQANLPQDRDQDGEAVSRKSQQGAQKAMDTTDFAVEGFDGKMINFSRPNTAGTGEQIGVIGAKDNLPMVRIDMIEA